ncbi:hypothetical protein [Aeromicrobium fastidiosum]|uniref:Uncharacterized protein n=1 Tax=Aeromicrobium fastidiosum TaxID=52699 RepID=A0A641AR24_9ACTN|nr:hypothetical protein [Aeromicrobium fastidiosum]KAA1378532.1 hypothetical protein ESP62_009290 [Aeromicrobium fastidiosum]MBP2392499.1 hypothetical protein [Aeromicrobium fastidiosum]
MTDPDGAIEPIRVDEVAVAAYRWDAWRSAAEATSRRARRTAGVLGLVVGLVAGVTGLVLLPPEARISVAELRSVVVPALVDVASDDSLESLLLNGGTLVVERSTVVVAEARDALVALVASEYDGDDLPPAVNPTNGRGP